MSEQKFPPRLLAQHHNFPSGERFWTAQEERRIYPDWQKEYHNTEYLSITEHQHILAEKDELLKVAREALDKVDCQCTVSERLSGHKTDCFIPELTEALNKLRGGNMK